MFTIFDPNTNRFDVQIGNKETKTPYKDLWVTLTTADNKIKIYRTDRDGNVLRGKLALDDGKMYYLADGTGYEYGALSFGWIYDPIYKHWYYSSSQTGTLVTGWQTVDGKDYYFLYPGAATSVNEYIDQYGMMLSNTAVDGYYLEENGARIADKPLVVAE